MDEDSIPKLIECVRAIEKATGGNLTDLRYTLETVATIWSLCPFTVGQRVRLTRTPVINEKESWGWLGSKHFLVKGAVATVMARTFADGTFRLGLHFDDETWIDHEKKIRPREEPHLFFFGARWLEAHEVVADAAPPPRPSK